MAKIDYHDNLTPDEFDLFSKFLKDLKELRSKKKVVHKENIWRPSGVRK